MAHKDLKITGKVAVVVAILVVVMHSISSMVIHLIFLKLYLETWAAVAVAVRECTSNLVEVVVVVNDSNNNKGNNNNKVVESLCMPMMLLYKNWMTILSPKAMEKAGCGWLSYMHPGVAIAVH